MANRIQIDKLGKLSPIEKLEQLRCPAMVEALKRQQGDPRYASMCFEERLEELIDEEYCARVNNSIARERKKAKLIYELAVLTEANYLQERKINEQLIQNLSTNDYIRNGQNIILIGASGCGKSWFANAFGNEALNDGFSVRYYRMLDLLLTAEEARKELGRLQQFIHSVNQADLLIIDDFLLQEITENEAIDLLRIIDDRLAPPKGKKPKSVIYCSQWTAKGWIKRIKDSTQADAIVDRIVNTSHLVKLEGPSMRELYNTLNTIREE